MKAEVATASGATQAFAGTTFAPLPDMQASISLGKIAGIPIGLHYSWFIIAILIALSLASHFTVTNPGWSALLVWSSAILTAVLFFATLLAHELSHALVARARQIPVRSITLFALGGVAQIEKDAGSARTEFWMGIAGPIMSFVIGVGCIGLAWSLGWSMGQQDAGAPAAILGWLGSINVLLAVFNLIPGYPLDGGRILRAALWGYSGDVDRATRQAANVGQFVAGLFIVFGLIRFFTGAGFAGLWLAFIGWFLLNSARASYAEVAITAGLRGVQSGEVMARDCQTVHASTPLDDFVDVVLRTGRRCFVVTRDGDAVVGLITPQEVKRFDPRQRAEARVSDAMRPMEGLKTVTPTTPVADALRIMTHEDLNQLPVVSDGHLEGVITRGHLLSLIQTRTELNL